MNQIKLTEIKKEKGTYKVTILKDENFQNFKITEDLLMESKFLSPRFLSEEEYKAFTSKLLLDSLLLKSMNYLDKRQKSERETREYLEEFTNGQEMIDKTIEILKNKGFINDENYKNVLVENLIFFKRSGRNEIRNKLMEAGLDPTFTYDHEALKENIEKLEAEFDRKTKNVPYARKIDKCKFFLQRRGYTEGEIESYFRYDLISKGDDKKSLSRDYDRLKFKTSDPSKLKAALLRKGYSMKDISEIMKNKDEEDL